MPPMRQVSARAKMLAKSVIDCDHPATVKTVAAACDATGWQREPVRFKCSPFVPLPIPKNAAAMSHAVRHEARCVPSRL
jgi:hypothetical protein